MKKKIIIFAVVLLMIVPTLAGCIIEYAPVTVRGGGWLPAPVQIQDEVEKLPKATFGFTVKCYNITYDGEVPTEWEVKGNFVYIDHFNGIRIKGKILDATYYEGGGAFYGEYTVGGVTGSFAVSVFDAGEPGKEDYFYIIIEDGEHDGYTNEGVIGGGNIQLFN